MFTRSVPFSKEVLSHKYLGTLFTLNVSNCGESPILTVKSSYYKTVVSSHRLEALALGAQPVTGNDWIEF